MNSEQILPAHHGHERIWMQISGNSHSHLAHIFAGYVHYREFLFQWYVTYNRWKNEYFARIRSVFGYEKYCNCNSFGPSYTTWNFHLAEESKELNLPFSLKILNYEHFSASESKLWTFQRSKIWTMKLTALLNLNFAIFSALGSI